MGEVLEFGAVLLVTLATGLTGDGASATVRAPTVRALAGGAGHIGSATRSGSAARAHGTGATTGATTTDAAAR